MEWPKIIWLGHISKLNDFDVACYHLNIIARRNQTGNVCFMVFVDGRKIVTTGKMCAFCHIDPSCSCTISSRPESSVLSEASSTDSTLR